MPCLSAALRTRVGEATELPVLRPRTSIEDSVGDRRDSRSGGNRVRFPQIKNPPLRRAGLIFTLPYEWESVAQHTNTVRRCQARNFEFVSAVIRLSYARSCAVISISCSASMTATCSAIGRRFPAAQLLRDSLHGE